MYFYKSVVTPVGELKLIASNQGLAAILWQDDNPKRVRLAPLEHNEHHPVLCAAETQLREYFAGNRQCFSLPLDFAGTEFQKSLAGAGNHSFRRNPQLPADC